MKTRLLAFRILNRVLEEGAYPDLALESAFRKNPDLSSRDAAFLTELVYGVIRWLAKLDYVISLFVNKKIKKKEILNILRIGVYQLLFLDSVSDYAAVSETVNLAKSIYGERIGGFINAVLREISRNKENIHYPAKERNPLSYTAVNYSFTIWLVKRWKDAFGLDYTERLCHAFNQVPPLTVRVNTLKTTREELIRKFENRNIEVIPTRHSPDGITFLTKLNPDSLPEFDSGLFTVQDEGAQLISYLLAPEPREKILDACSAPGGKSTHIAELMRNEGEIIAFDINRPRLKLVKLGAKRLGTEIIKTIRADASSKEVVEKYQRRFDKILVDAPCSGLGTLRRNPDAKWKRQEKDILALSGIQFKILSQASRMVKPQGIVVYAVCTLTREENEGVCERFLSENPEFKIDVEMRSIPWIKPNFIDKNGFFISDPVRHNMDAFFAARFRKVR